MNNSRAAQKVRVIRLDEVPAREAEAQAMVGDPASATRSARPDGRRWPQPIGSTFGATLGSTSASAFGSTFGATAGEASARPSTGRRSPPAHPVPLDPRGEPVLARLPRGRVKAWPVRVWSEPHDFARQFWLRALMVLCTAGLYAPWAVSHLRRALWRHTRVAGRSLDDHEPPLALASHWLLMLALLGGVSLSWRADRLLGLVAASLALLVWPHLLFLRLRRRASHVSWARRRMGFGGRCGEVYRAVWPGLLASLALMWATAAAAQGARPVGWGAWGLGLSCWLMGWPLALWAWIHWRQRQFRLGPWSLWWAAPPEGMAGLFWRTLVWLLLAGCMTAGVVAMAWATLLLSGVRPGPVGLALLLGAPVLLLGVAVRAYAQARLQNLVWGKTGNRHLRFQSRLDVAAYVRQQCRHAMLIGLTLGVYWPWAVAASHRTRMQAITVWSRVEADALREHWPVGLAVK